MFCILCMGGHYICSGPYGTRLHNFCYTWEKGDSRPRIPTIRSKKDSANDKCTQKTTQSRNGSIPLSRQRKLPPIHSSSRARLTYNKNPYYIHNFTHTSILSFIFSIRVGSDSPRRRLTNLK